MPLRGGPYWWLATTKSLSRSLSFLLISFLYFSNLCKSLITDHPEYYIIENFKDSKRSKPVYKNLFVFILRMVAWFFCLSVNFFMHTDHWTRNMNDEGNRKKKKKCWQNIQMNFSFSNTDRKQKKTLRNLSWNVWCFNASINVTNEVHLLLE